MAFGGISAPSDDTGCTKEKMGTKRCRDSFTRTLSHNGIDTLSDCMLKIRGMSQLCKLYSQCGPLPAYQPGLVRTSVCHSSEGFYKEEAVQRMCGVCRMFEATTPFLSESPTLDAEGKDGFGCFAKTAAVGMSFLYLNLFLRAPLFSPFSSHVSRLFIPHSTLPLLPVHLTRLTRTHT